MVHHMKALVPSISFSGAGFLGCYHLGVASSLLKHGYLLPKGEVATSSSSQLKNGTKHSTIASSSSSPSRHPILLGASAGALTCAGIAAGVPGEDAMDIVLNVARATREKGGILDALRPGFSLVDQVEKYLVPAMDQALNGDMELLQRRIKNEQGQSLLRIALSNKYDMFSKDKSIEEAYRYTDTYRDIEDICAAAVLSSFIPGVTGPVQGAESSENKAVGRAWKRLREMLELGFVKDGESEEVLGLEDVYLDDNNNESAATPYWDGGISNMWPIYDSKTLIVTPVNGNYKPNPFVAPALVLNDESDQLGEPYIPRMLKLNDRTEVGINTANLISLIKMCISSDDQFLERRFRNGYDDANRYLDANNLMRVFTR